MFCSAKKAMVVTIELSPAEAAGVKTTANLLRNLNDLIVATTQGEGNCIEFLYDCYGIVDFFNDLSDNPAQAEKILADYINTWHREID